ncbi:MAG: YihY/virulence factor BrkB family protein [Planctomycetaceae bacterium]
MSFLKQVFSEFSGDRCTTLAAALAYYTVFALPPLLYLLLTILTFGLSVAYDSEQADRKAHKVIERQAAQLLGNQAASEEISNILESDKQSGGKWWKTLISFAGILIGATGVVAALQDSLNRVWGVKPDPETTGVKDVIAKRLLSFAMILGLGFVLLVSLILSSLLSGAGEKIGSLIGIESLVASVINYVVQAAVILVVFAAIFRFMPDAEVHWRDVLVGAAVTTLLFLVGQYVMQLYFSYSDPGAQLGSAAASLAVILVWVYYSGLILLLGAEVTQVYAVRYGSGITPEKHAVQVVEEVKRDPVA